MAGPRSRRDSFRLVSSVGASAGPEGTHFRAHARRAVRLRAVISLSASGWHGEATVHDLSLGGAGVSLGDALQPGGRVVVSFLAPSLWDPLAIPARVAWVRPATGNDPTTAGLLFEPKDPVTVFALFELISTLA
jgi:hypothetical protein